jgi:hypothetical protein
VYRAYARALETDVAVKILDPRLAGDLQFRERFHDEARRLAQLHHPNLQKVHWYGEEGGLIYIVMRLVSGGTLLQRLQAFGGALPMTEAGRTILQIATALQHAHDHVVLHLDVKPANVLLGQADWPLVADLGLTQAIGRENSTSTDQSRIAGTPAYMSPEQCRGDDLDGRADQDNLHSAALCWVGCCCWRCSPSSPQPAVLQQRLPNRVAPCGGLARALTALGAAAAALLFTVGAAAPAAVAGPTVVSTASLSPELTREVDQVVVAWEFWVPWSPRADQATYNLSLSCSNGRPIGQFREAFTPPSGATMPDGPVGRLGPTSVACDDWQQLYGARRRAAGLPETPS